MRDRNRIVGVLTKINFTDFLTDILGASATKEQINEWAEKATKEVPQLIHAWKDVPDWRLTQLLVNLHYIPNLPGFWYYVEEVEWMKKHGYT